MPTKERWRLLLSSRAVVTTRTEPAQEVLTSIRKDVERTFPGVVDSVALYEVIHKCTRAYGYVQGMNFVAAVVLMAVEDVDKAVECFTALIPRLKGLYDPSHAKLASMCRVLDVLVEAHCPQVFTVLSNFGIRSEHYAINFWLCLFATRFEIDASIFIVEKFLVDGFKWLFRVAILLIVSFESQILHAGQSPDDLLLVLCKMTLSGTHVIDELERADERFKVTNSMIKSIEEQLSDDIHVSLAFVRNLNTGRLTYALEQRCLPLPEPVFVPPVFSRLKGAGLRIDSFLLTDLDSGHTHLFHDALVDLIRSSPR